MMDKRLLFASMVSVVTALGAGPLACSGSDATIGADAPDATGTEDGTSPDTGAGSDAGGSTDTGTGTDAGVDAGRRRDGGNDAGTDAAGNDGGLPDAAADAAYDGGPLNGCSGNYADRTNGGQIQRTITFPIGAPGGFTYSVPCMRIKAGQTVQIDGNYGNHPLAPLGGTVPTPFTLTNTGLSQPFTFPTAGTYGFHCQNHATMLGAIEVVN